MANTTPKSAALGGRHNSQMEGCIHTTGTLVRRYVLPRGISANHASHSECSVNWRETIISVEPSERVSAEQYSVQSCQETGRIIGSRTTA